MIFNGILTAITFLPLIGLIVVLFISDEQLIRRVAMGFALVVLALTTILWFAYNSSVGDIQFIDYFDWIPGIGVHYYMGVDGLSIPLIFLTGLLTVVSLYYSDQVIHTRVKEYYALFLLLETGMLGVFVSLNYFLFYVFWEIGLVPMYFLIGVWGGPRREYAAIKFFLYTLTGSVLMLLAIIGVYFSTGTFDIVEAAAKQPFANNFPLQVAAFLGFFAAFAIKVPLFPFHTWLPDAHVEAPTAGSVILAAVLLKLGTYGFVRVLLPTFPAAFQALAIPIGFLALTSIIYGALVAMAQWDFKKLIAYSSVNHMGYVVLGIAAAAYVRPQLNDPVVRDSAAIAITGATLEMFAHGIITGALFLMVGLIYDERTHTRNFRDFGGLFTQVPKYGAFLILFAMASLGLPGLVGFVAEFYVFRGAVPIMPFMAAPAVLGVVVTAAFFLWKVIQLILLGPLNERWQGKLTDLNRAEVLTLAPLAILALLFGVYPKPILDMINSAVVALLGKIV
ncbi:MAG: oxidoreductase [Chloroflexi bacterium RBG_16_57_9]|nr:MAG: oxidoreductase [Chloroflexi bacterium RBG_16_57_9]